MDQVKHFIFFMDKEFDPVAQDYCYVGMTQELAAFCQLCSQKCRVIKAQEMKFAIPANLGGDIVFFSSQCLSRLAQWEGPIDKSLRGRLFAASRDLANKLLLDEEALSQLPADLREKKILAERYRLVVTPGGVAFEAKGIEHGDNYLTKSINGKHLRECSASTRLVGVKLAMLTRTEWNGVLRVPADWDLDKCNEEAADLWRHLDRSDKELDYDTTKLEDGTAECDEISYSEHLKHGETILGPEVADFTITEEAVTDGDAEHG